MRFHHFSVLLSFFSFQVYASSHGHKDDPKDCPCKLKPRPDKNDKAETARWMVHTLDWGVLSTVSSRLDGGSLSIPFGNVYSFVDGPCHNSTGVVYFYATFMDQSFIDSKENPMASFTLSEASLSSVCAHRSQIPACTIGSKFGDPENPVCARLTLTGSLVVVDEGADEYEFARKALFKRHETMAYWPDNHDWIIGKLDIEDIWLIDYFGGASIISPDEYFQVNLESVETSS